MLRVRHRTRERRCSLSYSSFLQFLGVFSIFGVAWPVNIQTFLELFNVFNVDVDMLHLACTGLSYSGMWLAMSVLVPLSYPCFVLVRMGFSWVLWRLTRLESLHRPTVRLLRTGWRPMFSFKPMTVLFQWLPLGVRFLNIYYLTGLQRVMVLFKCNRATYAGNDVWVLAEMPSIRCWADDATFEGLLINSIVPGLFFVFGVLLIYSYVMIYLVRKRGLHDLVTQRVFGFLWNRFEDRCCAHGLR
jgi:hypothetical protein